MPTYGALRITTPTLKRFLCNAGWSPIVMLVQTHVPRTATIDLDGSRNEQLRNITSWCKNYIGKQYENVFTIAILSSKTFKQTLKKDHDSQFLILSHMQLQFSLPSGFQPTPKYTSRAYRYDHHAFCFRDRGAASMLALQWQGVNDTMIAEIKCQ